jgi:hypothetical protein
VATTLQTPLAPSSQLRIRLSAAILKSFLEAASMARARPETFAAEIIEAHVADYRLRKVGDDFPLPPRGEAALARRKNDNDYHRSKLSPEKKTEIRAFYAKTDITVAALARRFNIAETTAARVVKRKQAA